MLQDGNPAELLVVRGEELWKTRRGPKNASLEQCDLGLTPGVIKGAYARLPRYFADADEVMDFESRLIHCMVTLQGFDRAAVTRSPYSGAGQRQTDIEAITAYVVDQSRGTPVEIPQRHPKEKAAFERGKQLFYMRGGTRNQWLDKDMKPLGLTQTQTDDLIAFMEALTGDVTNSHLLDSGSLSTFA